MPEIEPGPSVFQTDVPLLNHGAKTLAVGSSSQEYHPHARILKHSDLGMDHNGLVLREYQVEGW